MRWELHFSFIAQFSSIHLERDASQAKRKDNDDDNVKCWLYYAEWIEWILWSYIFFRECIWKHKMRTIFLIICYYRCSLNRTLSCWGEGKKLPFNLELSQPLQSSFQFSILYNLPLLILSLSLTHSTLFNKKKERRIWFESIQSKCFLQQISSIRAS